MQRDETQRRNRVLTDEDREIIAAFHDAGQRLLNMLHAVGNTCGDALASPELEHAATKVEECVFWATKHITR